jgi:hypothetical protein
LSPAAGGTPGLIAREFQKIASDPAHQGQHDRHKVEAFYRNPKDPQHTAVAERVVIDDFIERD